MLLPNGVNKQALVTKFPINGLIFICELKKVQGLQAFLAPADLKTLHSQTIPNNFPVQLVDGEYEFNEEQFTLNWMRIAHRSTTNRTEISSHEKEPKDGWSTSYAEISTRMKADPDKQLETKLDTTNLKTNVQKQSTHINSSTSASIYYQQITITPDFSECYCN